MVYEKLPADIASRHVLLMDPILSTGHTTVKVIEALLSKGVQVRGTEGGAHGATCGSEDEQQGGAGAGDGG